MSIKFISGKPGGGKTLYSVGVLVEELEKGNRQIVTNISLKLDALQEYLLEKGCNKLVADWVRVIDEEETQEFWRYRVGMDLPDVRHRDQKNKPTTRFDFEPLFEKLVAQEIRPTVYFIDEIHIHFNSRAWMKTGEDALFYLSQHRKLGDDVYCITQSINNVDRQFRSVAQDYTYLRNRAVEKYGLVKGRNCFESKVFLSPDTGTQRECESHTFKLDANGIAACYDTAAGVGVQGLGADIGRKPKGLPFWTVWAGIAAVVAVMAGGMFMLPKAAAHMAGGLVSRTSTEVGLSVPGEKPDTGGEVQRAPVVHVVEERPQVLIKAVWEINGKTTVIFEDGRKFSGENVQFRGGQVWIEGANYRLASAI